MGLCRTKITVDQDGAEGTWRGRAPQPDGPASTPHRISHRLAARLRLPLQGGVIPALLTGNVVYTLDREHVLHPAKESGKSGPRPPRRGGSYESETGFVSGTGTDGPPSTTTGAKMLLHFCPVGVTLSWEEAHPGARASRPHKSSRSFGHLLHRNQPAAAPCLCFGRAHAVPAGRAVGCNIAGKLSGNRRDSMRAGRPRSRGCRPDGEVGGIRRATSLKAGLSPLGNSRLPASRAPAPRDWADPSRRTINGTSMHRMHRIIRTGGCCRRR